MNNECACGACAARRLAPVRVSPSGPRATVAAYVTRMVVFDPDDERVRDRIAYALRTDGVCDHYGADLVIAALRRDVHDV